MFVCSTDKNQWAELERDREPNEKERVEGRQRETETGMVFSDYADRVMDLRSCAFDMDNE